MTLVDLRGREHEPEVAALAGADGSILIGWDDGGGLAAVASIERSEDELHVRSLAVDPSRRGRGIGRALLDAIAGAATNTRVLVAESGGPAEFFARCGFVEENGRWIRPVQAASVDDSAVAAHTFADIEAAVRAAWSRETSDDPDDWSPENPAVGHCGVTALLIRELFGGEILIAGVVRDGHRVERHGWNRLPSGLTLDLTREQFRRGETFEQPIVGEPLVAGGGRERYELFARRVREALSRAPGA